MTDPRLYIETGPGLVLKPGLSLPASKPDSHYLISVMRRTKGDGVRLFNGVDGEWTARIALANRKGALLELIEQTRKQVESPDLTLLFAPVKRQKTELIVEKATELGARSIWPVLTQHTQADRTKMDRLEAIAKEASEQTERLDLPQINDPSKLAKVLEGWDETCPIFYCDEAGDENDQVWGGQTGRARPMLDVLKDQSSTRAAILIGPEGGFSVEERTQLRSLPFVHPVSLGPRILRAETAVIAALTLWQSVCGDWRENSQAR